MNGLAREEAPFSGRVWQEIDRVVSAVRASNCTARRFLEVDGPYGLGLTSVAGDEGWLQPDAHGADYHRWDVRRPPVREDGANPARVPPGTYLVQGASRPVPLLASEFDVGIRAVDAYESGCQPLDLCRATQAARDVALEEERLLYYGAPDDVSLLRIIPVPPQTSPPISNTTPVQLGNLIGSLHTAIAQLAARGYAGPFALAADPALYTALYSPMPIYTGTENGQEATSPGYSSPGAGAWMAPVLIVDLIRNLFRGGVYLVPVIDPTQDDPPRRRGAVVTVGCAYSRLVVGQDWVTTYRSRDGMYRFLIMASLQLRVCEPLSIQVLVDPPEETPSATSGRAARRRQ